MGKRARPPRGGAEPGAECIEAPAPEIGCKRRPATDEVERLIRSADCREQGQVPAVQARGEIRNGLDTMRSQKEFDGYAAGPRPHRLTLCPARRPRGTWPVTPARAGLARSSGRRTRTR
jgi:hypothetical protein